MGNGNCLPWLDFTIVTTLNPKEVEQRIAATVQDVPQLVGSAYTTKRFKGFIGSESFEISPILANRNSFNPLIKGWFSAVGSKTEVVVKMRLNSAIAVFSVIWLILTGTGCMFVLYFVFAHYYIIFKSGFETALLIPFGMFLFGFVLFTVPFKIAADKARKFLIMLLEGDQA